ncbi:MAG: MBOAT family O-acyltransferase [Candidatus Hodarchaeales archaeon]|jgi:D-alanyl-lipoteichoic acid acyltransferase DltB (MBOAT superfamily)
MLFNSMEFIFFFTIAMGLYFAIPYRFRWALLLGASYYFYMCSRPEYIFFLIVATVINYYVGIHMGKTGIKSKRKKYLIFSLFFNIGLLFMLKYYTFFTHSLIALFKPYNLFYEISAVGFLLPIGISFYTFKNLSYVIDVYRGDKDPEKHIGIFALYVGFFPQLLAGPIERSTRLIPQFFERYDFDPQRVTNGLILMLWGFFQKMVIADTSATLVDHVYNNPTQFHGISLIMATVFFTFQIYCDFAGYSNIAIGAAQVMGYTTMDNFNRPYFSKSVSEFWRRWHISLSTWFRDYLYIPLGGSRVSIPRWYFNLFIVLLLCGLWHGANWTFMIWGGLHGFYLVFSIVTQSTRIRLSQFIGLNRLPKILHSIKVVTTFFLICFAWIFFRANNISDAFYIVSHLFTGWENELSLDVLTYTPFWGSMRFEFLVATTSIGFLFVIELIQGKRSIIHLLSKRPTWIRWMVYYSIFLAILLFGNLGSKQFIYFQF